MIHKVLLLLFLFTIPYTRAQQLDTVVLNFKEYLGYIKKYHPIAKQAELKIGEAQANLMKSRGGFDPKMVRDRTKSQF